MLSPSPPIRVASERLAPGLKDDVYAADVRQLVEDEGCLPWSPEPGTTPTLVYFGARSGLEAHLAQVRFGAARIVLVEADPVRRAAVGRSLARHGAVVCPDPADAPADHRNMARGP